MNSFSEFGTFFAPLSYYQLSMPVLPLPRVPAHDAANAFKIYDRAMLNAIRIESKGGFELSLEITVKVLVLLPAGSRGALHSRPVG
jgi:hypothetical protein